MIVSGTGHRPPKLGGYGDEPFAKLVAFAKDMFRQHFRHELHTSTGSMIYIGGLALGWDQASMLAADSLGCRVWGYAPCTNMDSKWPQWSKDQYARIVSICEKVIYVYEGDYPGPWCMIKRDEAMVDDSQHVLALYDDSLKGGTYHTVNYAIKQNKPVTNVWEQWVTLNA